MRKQHLTPDGLKPCNAFFRKCKYEIHTISDEASAFINSAVEDVQKGNPYATKNFFDRLCGPLKKSSSKLDSTKYVPVEIEPTNIYEFSLEEYDEDDDDEGLDKVKGENGQYQITCRASARHFELPIMHKFGDFIKNKTTAESLHDADPRKEYQLGWCAVLAKKLRNNEHVVGYYMFKTEKEPVIGEHHFVKLKDGTYADSLGIWTEKALLSKWKEKEPTAELSLCDPDSPEIKGSDALVTEDIFPEMTEIITKEVTKLIDKHMNGETL